MKYCFFAIILLTGYVKFSICKEKPNIIFLLSDDQRDNSLGAYDTFENKQY